MGTRSITVVKDENNNKIIEMYQQYDGYPEGVGARLEEFIKSGTLVDGYGMAIDKQFNGISCFAAQLVDELKDGVGGTYLHAPTYDYDDKGEYSEKYWAEYYYEIDHELTLRCWSTYDSKLIFTTKKDEEREEV